MYLSAARKLASHPVSSKPATFVYDPADPVPTIGGRYGLGSWTPNCYQDQVCRTSILGCTNDQPLSARNDVLAFITEPLTKPLEVTGPVRVRLWVSSDAPDTDFTAKLIDVAPDGYAAILTDGQTRVRYRKGFDREVPLKPGEIAEVTVELGATSNLFAAGHRIRLDVSSSNWPRVEPNPNTGDPVNRARGKRKARNTIYMDGRRPSHVELPVVPVR
jgi:putative CocE/NonD family hydrolase